jgi:dTDP-4-amino-4,6-dideoxygalactose transaminase
MPPYRITFGHLQVGQTARRYLQEALDRNWVSEGPNVAAFERRFATHFNYHHAVATSSGTDAGIVVWAALADAGGWQRGDEVITPAAAFVATANAVLAAGLTPVFVDIALDTLNIDPAKIEAAITPRTRAIQAVHTMGRLCDMTALRDIADRHHLALVEDACEAHGASRDGALVGTIGDAAVFSFYAAHLICSGEGGMIVTANNDLAARCRSVRSHGRRNGELYFAFDRLGFNSKMNDMEAAIGLEGLEGFTAAFDRRRQVVHTLRTRLTRWADRVSTHWEGPNEVLAPHAFPLVLRDPDASIAPLYAHLEQASIQCKTLFGSLPTQHVAFRFLGYAPGTFPVAERLHTTGLHFGVHQYLSDADVTYVADQIDAYFETHGF